MSGLVGWLRANLSYLILALAILLFFLLRTSPTDGINSVESLDTALAAGQPVVIEFYSNL
jgi:hypothetical protein